MSFQFNNPCLQGQAQGNDLQAFGQYCTSILAQSKGNESKSATVARKKSSFSIASERKESYEEKKSERISRIDLYDQEDDEDFDDDASHTEHVEVKNSPKKYSTYSKDDKQKIVDYVNEYGIEAAYQTFKAEHPKLTKRRLTQWQANIHKKKNTKGKKTNDPVRDRELQTWYKNYIEHYKMNPTRREIQEKALEISETPDFMASKGWVDKICVRLNFEVTKVKCKSTNGKPKKKVKTQEQSETTVTSRKTSIEAEEPAYYPEPPVFSHTETMGNNTNTCDINAFFDFNSKESFEKNDNIPYFESENMMTLLEKIN